jgi:hypothetical protein
VVEEKFSIIIYLLIFLHHQTTWSELYEIRRDERRKKTKDLNASNLTLSCFLITWLCTWSLERLGKVFLNKSAWSGDFCVKYWLFFFFNFFLYLFEQKVVEDEINAVVLGRWKSIKEIAGKAIKTINHQTLPFQWRVA